MVETVDGFWNFGFHEKGESQDLHRSYKDLALIALEDEVLAPGYQITQLDRLYMVETNEQSEEIIQKQAYPRIASISSEGTRCAPTGMFADADSETPNGERVLTPMNPNRRAEGQEKRARRKRQVTGVDLDKGGKTLKLKPR